MSASSTSTPLPSPPPPPRTARCVLWSLPTHSPDASLVRALTRPGMHVRPVYDDLGAVATILEGVSTTDLAQSNSLGEHRILLLVEPNKLQHVPESVELLSRYIHDLSLIHI